MPDCKYVHDIVILQFYVKFYYNKSINNKETRDMTKVFENSKCDLTLNLRRLHAILSKILCHFYEVLAKLFHK